MANIVARIFFSKNVMKIKHFSNLSTHPFASIVCTRFERQKTCNNKFTLAWRAPGNGITYYSIDSKKGIKPSITKDAEEKKEKKLTLFQKFKIMYRDYWYVLVPVHLVTSAAWFGGFYFMAKSGIDIIAILESWHVSERLVNPLRDSSMGYFAVSYALYKISTPARYTVTLGGTTLSINYLKKWGYIKPVPSKERIKEIYEEKKETLAKSVKETKEGIKETKENIIETVREAKEGIIDRKDNLLETLEETKKGLKEQKDHILGVKENKQNTNKLNSKTGKTSDVKGKK